MRVELWDEDRPDFGLVDRISTGTGGTFTVDLDGASIADLFVNRQAPVLFFRVFDGDRLLTETKDSVTWRPSEDPGDVRILVDFDHLPSAGPSPAQLQVRGSVIDAEKGPLVDVVVEALDRVLVRSGIRDIEVGRARTDERGRYRITYGPVGDKVKADLTVRAIDGRGRQLAATHEPICQAPATSIIDLVLNGDTWRGPTEFDSLTSQLADVPIVDLDDDAATFVRCSRNVDRWALERLRSSARLARDRQLSQGLLYALGSAGIPIELRPLLAVEPAEFEEAVRQAVEANRVPRRQLASLEDDLAALRAAVVAEALGPSQHGKISLGDLLATGTTDRAVHQSFLERFVARRGTEDDFWVELAGAQIFSGVGIIEDVRLSLQLALLTQCNLPLLQQLGALRREGRLGMLSDLTALDRDDWRRLLNESGDGDAVWIPSYVPGSARNDRIEHYLDSIIEPLEEMFPGHYLRRSIAREPEIHLALVRGLLRANRTLDPHDPLPFTPAWDGIPIRDRELATASWAAFRAEVLAFPEFRFEMALQSAAAPTFINPIRAGVDSLLTNLGDPDLRTTRLDNAIAERGDEAFDGIAVQDRPAVLRQAQAYQRIFRVAPRAAHVEALLGSGLNSALAIALISRKRFVRDFGEVLGDEPAARRVHDTAKHIAGTVQSALQVAREAYVDVVPWAIGGSS